jgi:hypothetical protein
MLLKYGLNVSFDLMESKYHLNYRFHRYHYIHLILFGIVYMILDEHSACFLVISTLFVASYVTFSS